MSDYRFCEDCPDREACSQGASCERVRELNHNHTWRYEQNVTSSGYRMPPYRVCDECDRAEQIKESPRLSRVTVVDRSMGGVVYERYDVEVEVDYQDGGRTLKVFVK